MNVIGISACGHESARGQRLPAAGVAGYTLPPRRPSTGRSRSPTATRQTDSTDQRTPDTFDVSVNPTITMDYKAWNFTQEDNFCRIDVDRAGHRLVVHVFDWKGARVQKEDPNGRKQDLISELDLAAW